MIILGYFIAFTIATLLLKKPPGLLDPEEIPPLSHVKFGIECDVPGAAYLCLGALKL